MSTSARFGGPTGHLLRASCIALGVAVAGLAGQAAFARDTSRPITTSALDAELFYQLLIAETELRRGESATAFQLVVEAARRTRDESLFRRAVDIAVRSRAGEQALSATRAWRIALPRSREAAQSQAQLLLALGRAGEAAEPVRAMIDLVPASDRAGLVAALARLVPRGEGARAGATMLDEVLKPYREGKPGDASSSDATGLRVAAMVTTARAWVAAGDEARGLQLAAEAQGVDATAEGPALLGLEVMKSATGETLVKRYLDAAAKTDGARANPLRMGYARRLTAGQRYAEAVTQLEQVTATEPGNAAAWLTLGALHLELAHPRDATAALTRFVDLRGASVAAAASASAAAAATAAAADDDDEGSDDAALRGPEDARAELNQAYLMLSQAAEQQKDFASAQAWIEKLGDARGSAQAINRRASLLARQGKLREARELVRSMPETTPEEARGKVFSESQLLREARQWTAAHDVLASANQRFADDPDLLYEQAMMAEKLNRLDDMERLLRRVMQLKPDHHHAFNALGYSLADRNLRLPEARQLVARALELAPGDPFITDSLGWVEFRAGNREEALRLLREAYAKRPDPEIAAHLGEVLWSAGQRDEARRIWREGRSRDAANDVLKETLARLRVSL
jgi:tetratricopeptide (TPR) repeat protein